MGNDPVNTWAYDYCTVKAPAMGEKGDACRPNVIPEWGQCGGKSNCTEWGCADEQWAGACCTQGLECRRQDDYFWQCVNPNTKLSASGGATSPATEAPASGTTPTPSSPAASPAPASLSELAASLPSLQTKSPGAKVYVTLKIDYSYDSLVADVGAQARLKSDVVTWLKANAGDPEYIYSAGGLGVESVIARDCSCPA